MEIQISAMERDVFAVALKGLNAAGIPYVIAGAFCTHFYTRIWRYTKDMDVFTRPEHATRALEALASAGYQTWVEADHWLGKAAKDYCLVDVIYGTGNWLAPVDDGWFDRAVPTNLFDVPVRMASREEMIWAKSYIAGRERYDGADVCHLIRSAEGRLDWRHLIDRYETHWPLLLSYLNLYCFIYPANQSDIPDSVIRELNERQDRERRRARGGRPLCRGTLLDRFSYNFDVEHLGYVDAREKYAVAHGGSRADVVKERDWARQKLANGEVYSKEATE